MHNKTLDLWLLTAVSITISGCITDKIHGEVDKDQVRQDYEDTQAIPAKPVQFHDLTATFTPSSQPFVQGTMIYSLTDDGLIKVAPLSEKSKAKIMEAFTATNQVRAEKGLPPLKYDENLGAYAAVRAKEIAKDFSHQRPDGSRYYSGLTAGSSAENIASGHSSGAETVLEQWKSSKDHYKNLTGHYEKIGLGYTLDPQSQYGYYWVQIFGSAHLDSTYRFDTTGSLANATAIGHLMTEQITAPKGRLHLGQTPQIENQAARTYQAGELTHSIYKAARHYDHNGYQAIVQDPTEVFTYQTFGEILDPQGMPIQFVNLGQSSIPQTDITFHAHYSGVSLGTLDGKEHVYADVAADVNFGNSKTMSIEFSNTKKGTLTDSRLSPAQDLNFAENLLWQDNHFRGQTTKAQFYGPNGEEIGGTFSRKTSIGRYEGVFGAQKN